MCSCGADAGWAGGGQVLIVVIGIADEGEALLQGGERVGDGAKPFLGVSIPQPLALPQVANDAQSAMILMSDACPGTLFVPVGQEDH